MHLQEAEDIEILAVCSDSSQIVTLTDFIVSDVLIWIYTEINITHCLTLESLFIRYEKLFEAESRSLDLCITI